MMDSKGTEEVGVFARREGFHKDVHRIICCGDVVKVDDTCIDLFAHIMVVRVNVLHSCVVSITSHKGNKRLVVSEKGNRCKIMPEVPPESNQPDSLC